MKKKINSKIFAVMIAAAMTMGLMAGCGNTEEASTQETQTEAETQADEETEAADTAEETTEETAEEVSEDTEEETEAVGQDGFIYGSYWSVSFDPEAYFASQDGSETVLAYQNDPAGSAFYVFTETDYESPEACMEALAAKQDLTDYTETTINGDRTLFASLKTDDSQESALQISDDYYAVDVNGNVLQIEEFITLSGDDDADNEIYTAMLEIIADHLDFEETGDYPDNFMEERTGIYSYYSQEQIIDSLEAGEGYAYVNVMGMDDPVLVITNDIFTPDDDTANCLSCYPYYKDASGKYVCGSVFSTISTGTPIAVSDDGVVYCATHNEMTELVFNENGQGIMALEYVYVNWAQDDSQTDTYGGFVRESNSFDAAETEIEETDSSYFEKAFEEYDKLTPINFTVVE